MAEALPLKSGTSAHLAGSSRINQASVCEPYKLRPLLGRGARGSIGGCRMCAKGSSARGATMSDRTPPPRPHSYDKKVGLVLQGGGALGSYQAGVYEALASSDYLPDWVAGISIGAINAAIIAGNAPEKRVAQLRRFWEAVSAPTAWWPAGLTGSVATWQRSVGGLAAIMF